MPEEQFWKTTPRKLNALAQVYVYTKGGKTDAPKMPKQVFIDQVL